MPRSFSHWTPRYCVNRLLVLVHERLHPDAPWLTADAVRFLDDNLRPSMSGVECGSGRSTLWIAQRIGTLISLEHDPDWHSSISAKLRTLALENVTYHFAAEPTEYVDKLKQLPDASTEFMLVDGLERDRCFREGMRIVKPGGLLVLDNANWYLPHDSRSPNSVPPGSTLCGSSWAALAESIRDWLCLWTSNGVSDTAIFVKPLC